ncbi:hypothetical protein ACR31U_35030 (plasmid) [Streptomyces rochei]|uniref:hypothetical protein n=1 Tax=Streptomyces rochei TaxID=1928 RepID=UPI00402AAD5E
MLTLAGEWYTSGTFWAAAAVVVAALAAPLTVWGTLRAANPKRRVEYGVRADNALLHASPQAPQALEVTLNGNRLTEPRVVEVVLANTGRRDITRAMFDADRPLLLDTGTPVVDILSVSSDSPQHTSPTVTVTQGTVLTVAPCLLAREQTVTVTLLADGPRASASLRSPLIDVAVRKYRDGTPFWEWVVHAVAIALLLGVSLWLMAALFDVMPFTPVEQKYQPIMMVWVVFCSIAGYLGAKYWRDRRARTL